MGKPLPIRDSKFSEQNHTMLVQLGDNVTRVGESLKGFIESQSQENRRLHARIDDTNSSIVQAQNSMAASVGSIKDAFNERSRITPSLIAMALSLVAILCGALTAYIDVRSAPVKTDIQNVSTALHAMVDQQLVMRQEHVGLQVHTAEEDSAQRTNQHWLEKELDEARAAIKNTRESAVTQHQPNP
jgi:hypothetical protein